MHLCCPGLCSMDMCVTKGDGYLPRPVPKSPGYAIRQLLRLDQRECSWLNFGCGSLGSSPEALTKYVPQMHQSVARGMTVEIQKCMIYYRLREDSHMSKLNGTSERRQPNFSRESISILAISKRYDSR
jgi:hypothetical protein